VAVHQNKRLRATLSFGSIIQAGDFSSRIVPDERCWHRPTLHLHPFKNHGTFDEGPMYGSVLPTNSSAILNENAAFLTQKQSTKEGAHGKFRPGQIPRDGMGTSHPERGQPLRALTTSGKYGVTMSLRRASCFWAARRWLQWKRRRQWCWIRGRRKHHLHAPADHIRANR
jgi:hypothetical protein